jgi:hypothetical protein
MFLCLLLTNAMCRVFDALGIDDETSPSEYDGRGFFFGGPTSSGK